MRQQTCDNCGKIIPQGTSNKTMIVSLDKKRSVEISIDMRLLFEENTERDPRTYRKSDELYERAVDICDECRRTLVEEALDNS